MEKKILDTFENSCGRKIICVAASDRHKQKQIIFCLLLPRKINKSKFLGLGCDKGYCAAKTSSLSTTVLKEIGLGNFRVILNRENHKCMIVQKIVLHHWPVICPGLTEQTV